MRMTIFQYLKVLPRGVCLVALLASASAVAETRTTPADEAVQRQGNSQPTEHQATAPAPVAAVKLVPATSGNSRTTGTKRVYLEDYDRVHRRVIRQYPTETYWVGKNPRPN